MREQGLEGCADRWIDPVMSGLLMIFLAVMLFSFAVGAFWLAGLELLGLIAVAPVLAVRLDQDGCAVTRFARPTRSVGLEATTVDVWHGARGGTTFARVREQGRRRAVLRAFGGPAWLEAAALRHGVVVTEAAPGDRPDVSRLAVALFGAVIALFLLMAIAFVVFWT